ncbi:MAG: cytochrome class [Spirosoma sp.]|nr:cytochrome class [Spirosoma sp.]
MKTILTLVVCLCFSMGYAQTSKPTTKPVSKPTVAAIKQPGQVIFEQNCLTCHQANGSGVPNLNPPLRGSEWVVGDKTRLINVLLKGLQGQEIDGEMYDNAMPAHDFLDDAQIADVLTYIRSNFGNKADAVKVEEVKAVRGK